MVIHVNLPERAPPTTKTGRVTTRGAAADLDPKRPLGRSGVGQAGRSRPITRTGSICDRALDYVYAGPCL